MTHIKRQNTRKNWPIPRKGGTFIINSGNKGIPVLVLLRDMLKVARTRKEVKRAILEKNILVCGKTIKDERKNVELFDTLSLVPSKEDYRLTLSKNGKYMLEKIKHNEREAKISKIINKKTLKGKKIQINLSDGRNYLTNLRCSTNDSVMIDFSKNKIEKCLPLEEKSNVFIIGGKHAGKIGIIKKINEKLKIAEILENQQRINVLIKQLMVIE